ncbi:MAG: M48 family metalloprotease [Candidatus Eremiobacteraeota bacterium]|nr:M48 family metalloprotease [Candidatus Eremiobacteraeota bacterium]
MFVRRVVYAALSFTFIFSMLPSPARAMSTAAEIEQAKEQEKQIIEQYNVIPDPLMNRWVDSVSDKLWNQVARRDLPYNIKILDSPEINSFTIGGGYVYVNSGLLDFVQSDDELAGVIGHETGHNERRHTVTLPAKAQALNLLFSIASIFSPFIYRFGQLAEAGLLAKQSRADELQADQYGLQLMSRAGYDPDSMVSFMDHMGAAGAEHSSLVDKYFEGHPGFPSRVSHLVGYYELDPKKRTTDQILVQALHDQSEARYSVAAIKFGQVLKANPDSSIALLHLGEAQIALGEPDKSRQTLGEAAQKGSSETRAVALSKIAMLQEAQPHFVLGKPNLAPLRAQLADAQTREVAADATLAARRDAGRDLIKSVNTRVQNVSYGIPDLSRVQVRRGSRLEAVVRNFNSMGRSIEAAFGKSSAAINEVGTMQKNRQSGLVKENADILHELAAPLSLDPVPAQSLALLPAYPRMFDAVNLSDGDMVGALDAARSSLALLDVSLGDLNDFAQRLGRVGLDFNGDISVMDYDALIPLMKKAGDGLSKAAIAGSQAEQLVNMARARQLETRITMLGVGSPRDRYATLRYALQQRVQNDGVDYTTMQHDDLTAGEVAAASVVAADTNTTPSTIIDEAKSSGRTIVDVANERGMRTQSLEIFLGLIYLDYTDDPVQEAHVPSSGVGNNHD